jgi:opacity protein-like surface antigen
MGEMSRYTLGLIPMAVTAQLLAAAPTLAQSRRGPAVPAPGMMAIGASVGVAPPSDASFTSGLDLSGTIEGYVTRRVSVRGQVSGAFWDITGRNFTGTARPVAFDGNLVYNFEGGRIHPFLTAGVGLYHYRFSEPPTSGSANKAGFAAGGGVEYFLHRYATATIEVLHHGVSGTVNSPLAGFDGSYWTITIGLKKYFAD